LYQLFTNGLLVAIPKSVLKIQRSANAKIVLTLSGRIEVQDVAELRRLLTLEAANRPLVLDLNDVTLVDREAVKFLAQCEADSIEIENCPPYIREWIQRESGRSRRKH
jgi:STAS domain-containing protein